METDTALVTGAFALGGVIVGGVLNNWLGYVLERRREGWAGKTKARMFMPRMIRLAMALGEALEDEWTWDEACLVIENNLDDFWPDFAEVFAGTFSNDEWETIYRTVRPLEQMTNTAPRDGTKFAKGDEEYIAERIDALVEATMTLVMIGHHGPNRRRRLIRGVFWSAWEKLRPLDERKVLEEAGIEQDDIDAILEE